MKAPPPEQLKAQQEAMVLLLDLGWERPKIAAALSISVNRVKNELARLGVRKLPPVIEPIPGEEWADVPGWPVRVSSFGRFQGVTGGLLKFNEMRRPGGRPRILLTHYQNGSSRRVNYDAAALMMLAFGLSDSASLLPDFVNGDHADLRLRNLTPSTRAPFMMKDFPWTKEDDVALVRAPTRRAALKESRHSEHHTAKRIRALGLTWPILGPKPVNQQARFARLYRECRAILPGYLKGADREDVASAALVLLMERQVKTPKEAVELARKSHGRMFNRWRDLSVDAPIPGTDGLTHLDRLSGEHGLQSPG